MHLECGHLEYGRLHMADGVLHAYCYSCNKQVVFVEYVHPDPPTPTEWDFYLEELGEA